MIAPRFLYSRDLRALGLALALTLARPEPALAVLHLTVGDCGGSSYPVWTCTSNAGTAVHLVASVMPTTRGMNPVAHQSILEFAFYATPDVPAWWRIGTGGCRAASAITVNHSGASYGCLDQFGLFPGGATGSFEYLVGPQEPGTERGGTLPANQARLIVRSTVDTTYADAVPGLTVGDEMFLFAVSINKSRTVGTDACAGCTQPLCVYFRSARLTLRSPTEEVWESGVDGDWPLEAQGAYHGMCWVPTKRSTWGQVKSLYR